MNTKPRLTNASDFITNDKAYQVFPEGINVCQINLPRGIEYSKREKFLFSTGLMFLALNPDLEENSVYSYISSINLPTIIGTPISSQSLSKIVSQIFSIKNKDGEIKIINNKKRKIIFNDKYKLSNEEKRQITNKEMGNIKTQQTLNKIKILIDSIIKDNKEIKPSTIAEELKVSLKTISNYWSNFEDMVIQHNESLGLDTTSKKELTLLRIYNQIEKWDFETLGKITIKKVAAEVNMAEITIKGYWSTNFKDYVKELNNDFKGVKKEEVKQDITPTEKVSEIEDNNVTEDISNIDLSQKEVEELGYSVIQLGKHFIPNAYLEYYDLVKVYKGITNKLRNEFTQKNFNLVLKNEIKNKIN
jgi:hypothetical protein